tara:strand:+ start:859 stop:3366 length:2508 start_codon:yes stop_codon:yes gene_type:complete
MAANSFLGAFQAVQGANQARFDNQLRARALDLDERTLAEKTRQFEIARAADDRRLEIDEDRMALDELKEYNRASEAIQTQALDQQRINVYGRQVDELSRSNTLAEEEARIEEDVRSSTERARIDLIRGNIDESGMLTEKFFETDSGGKLKNKSRIIDYLNTQTGALISNTADGPKDMEVVGFEVLENGNRRVLLRRKDGSKPEVVPATEGASDSPEDTVIEMTQEEFRGAVRNAYDTEESLNIDPDKLNLSVTAGVRWQGKQRASREEKVIKEAALQKYMDGGNAAVLRGISKRLIETKDDPEGRKLLLEELDLDPAQFAGPDPKDPNKEFLGPDTILTDPLEGKYAITDADLASSNVNVGGSNPYIGAKKKGKFQTENKNLVATLRENFSEEDDLLSTTRTTGADRDTRLGELQEQRKQLIKAIPDEINARKAVRAAYADKLNSMNMSDNDRNAALEEYDAYISQLEGYLAPAEKRIVDIGAEVGNLIEQYSTDGKLDEAAFGAALAAGELPISADDIGLMQKYLVDKDVKELVDLNNENRTTQYAALSLIASSVSGTAQANVLKTISNITATGQDITLKDIEQLALDAKELDQKELSERRKEEGLQTRDTADRVAAQATAVREQSEELFEELNTTFNDKYEIDVAGKSADQTDRLRKAKELAGKNLTQKVNYTWSSGSGAKAFDVMKDSSQSSALRKSATQHFMQAGRSSIAALLATRSANAGYEEDLLDFGDEYKPSDQPIVQQTVSMQDVIVEMKGDNVNRFRLKRSDGGTYQGAVTARELKQRMGADAYDVFLAELDKSKREQGESGFNAPSAETLKGAAKDVWQWLKDN